MLLIYVHKTITINGGSIDEFSNLRKNVVYLKNRVKMFKTRIDRREHNLLTVQSICLAIKINRNNKQALCPFLEKRVLIVR